MEHHQKFLQELCRLCGRKIKLNEGYTNPKGCLLYKETLAIIYDIDAEVEKQHPENFPLLLCASCKRKLEHMKKKNESHNKLSAIVFQPHGENCEVCKPKKLSKKDKNVAPHVKHFDEIAAKFGLVKIPDRTNERRCYCLIEVNDNDMHCCKMALSIKTDFSWSLQVNNRLINLETLSAFGDVPRTLNDDNFNDFLNFIVQVNYCKGCHNFNDLIQSKLEIKEPFLHNKTILAKVETIDGITLEKENFKIVRHSNCNLVAPEGGLCSSCHAFLNTLRVQSHRQKNQRQGTSIEKTSDQSTVNLKTLSREELEERYANAQKSKRSAVRKVAHQSRVIATLIEEKGYNVDGAEHDILANVMDKNDNPIDESSPMALLWEQQKQLSSKKDIRGMRWHPLVIRWCLSIYCSSPSAYSSLSNKNIGFLRLPHPTTLKPHLHFTEPSSGFNPDIIKRLVVDSNLETAKDFQKNVTLCFDEMKIKSDLVFSKSTGKIIGFSEMGSLNEEMKIFDDSMQAIENRQKSDRDIASYVLVYMVRGIFSHLTYPIGYFASTGFSAHHLYPTTLHAICILEKLGFKVRCLTADGAGQNRKLFSLFANHDEDAGKYGEWGWNPCTEKRKLYFMSDVPHLLKTTRNCLENSHGNLNTRNLVFDRKSISWNHIVNAYEDDVRGKFAMGLRFIPKITEEHVHLNPRLRMNVKWAAQLISMSMAQAIERKNDDSLSSTVTFLKIFDKVFDCMNVSRRFQDQKGKKELAVYESVDDWRFEMLTDRIFCILFVWTIIPFGHAHYSHIKVVKRSAKRQVKGVDTFVDDIKESTDYAGREKKIKSMLESQGEMLTEHALAKRRFSKKVSEMPHLEERPINKPEVVGEKKSVIERKEENLSDAFARSDLVEDADDDTSEDNESGSGSASEENDSDTDILDKEKVSNKKGERRKLQCRKKCTTPMSFKECALPRCTYKVGTIKDLCFYLCKHQKERCEDVCDEE